MNLLSKKREKRTLWRMFGISMLLCLFLPHTNLVLAQEAPKTLKDAKFELKFGGMIYSGFEFLDHQDGSITNNGELDAARPDQAKQGFRVNRVYITLQGQIKEGSYKDWGFHITSDMAPAGKQGDGCGSDNECSQNNDYNQIIKYAYLTLPIRFLDNKINGKNLLRLGQQHTPVVDGKAGVSLQALWGHRYLAQASFEDAGLAVNTDRGLGFIHENSRVGLHLLLANGDGFNHNNGEGIEINNDTLASGNTPSRALDLYAFFSVALQPLARAKNGFFATLSFPLRLLNFYGIPQDELQYEDPNTSEIFQGKARAKRDVNYGSELTLQYKGIGWRSALGLGALFKKDKRDNVINLTTQQVVSYNRDAYGHGHYVYAHVRWRHLGMVARYTEGSAVSGTQGRIDTRIPDYDHGDGLFQKYVYAVSYSPTSAGVESDFFHFAVGREEVRTRQDSRIASLTPHASRLKSDVQTFIRTQLKF